MARLPDDEIQRRYQENLARLVGTITEEQKLELWPELTSTERNRRAKSKETWQARHETIVDDESQQRLVGGPQTPRNGAKKLIGEAVSDLVNGSRQTEVIDGLFAGLHEKNDPAVKGKAAERLVKIANEQLEIERRDRDELRKLGEDDIIAQIAKLLVKNDAGDRLVEQLTARSRKTISATAVDMDVDAA